MKFIHYCQNKLTLSSVKRTILNNPTKDYYNPTTNLTKIQSVGKTTFLLLPDIMYPKNKAFLNHIGTD